MALCAGAHAAPDATLTLRLQQTLQVGGERWSLADAVEAAPEWRARLALDQIRLAAPTLGQVERFSSQQIEQTLRRRAAGNVPAIQWEGARHLQVARASRTVLGAELAAAAVQAWRAGAAQRVDAAVTADPVADIEVPLGEFVIRPRAPARNAGGRSVQWLDIWMGERVVRSASVVLREREGRTVLVAKRSLRAGTALERADFDSAAIPGAPGDALAPEAWPRAARLRHAVRAGQTLNEAALMASGAVRRGEPVRLVLRQAGMTVETLATATADAEPGQLVAVHWNQAREPVRGRLLASGEVVIE